MARVSGASGRGAGAEAGRDGAGGPAEGRRRTARGDPDGTPAQATAEQLHSAAIHLLRRLRREDDASGLTAPRLSALSVVVFAGPLSLGALAAAEQVRPPTMSRIVAALESAGLLAREPSPADGRVVLIRATEAGRGVLEAGRDRRTAVLTRRISLLTPRERDVLRQAAALMERLALPEDGRPARPAGASGGPGADQAGLSSGS